ncbi:MAG: efflux RND transporter periplasmic adaptor subunit [Hyphomicrobiaceae bacterium]
MTKHLTRYLFTLGLPLALLGAGGFWMLGNGANRAAGMVYDTQPAKRGAIRKLVSTSGPVRALVTVSVGSQLSGQLSELKVDFNSEVKENDVLAVLDDKTFAAKVAQAKADLAIARAALTNQEAALKKSEAVLRQAERVTGRQQVLAQKGITAAAAVDTATRDSEVAKAEISVAKAQIESAKAQIAQREAQLLQAEIDLDRTRIRSPINGTVISRTIDIGQTVAASLQAPELFKIAQDLRRIRIEAQVNEADVGAVTDGNVVEFTVDAYPERRFEGRVTQVRLAATELQNVVTYTVIIEAENNDRKLFPGMTANVRIETARRDNVLTVPNDATRFKPRNRTAEPAAAETKGGGQGNRNQRMVEQIKDDLKLDDQQTETLRTELAKVFQEMRAAREASGAKSGQAAGPPPGFGGAPPPQQGGDMAGNRARIAERIDQILGPILTDAQRPAFDRWKRGRDASRPATLWVLKADGDIEARNVRLGIADETTTEVLGNALKDGEKIVVRARELKK